MPNLARTRSSGPIERIQNPGMLAEVAAGLSAPRTYPGAELLNPPPRSTRSSVVQFSSSYGQ